MRLETLRRLWFWWLSKIKRNVSLKLLKGRVFHRVKRRRECVDIAMED